MYIKITDKVQSFSLWLSTEAQVNGKQTELCGFDDLLAGSVEKGSLDDTTLEVRPVDAVVNEVVVDADRAIERWRFDRRHTLKIGV